MTVFADILTVLLPVLYALAAANSIVIFVRRSDAARKADKPLVGVSVGVHAITLLIRGLLVRRCPLATVSDAMGLMAFSLVAVYFYLLLRKGTRPTGILTLPIAFFLELVSVAIRKTGADASPALASPWFNIHVLAAILAIAALAVSFVHGVFYLHLYRQIKGHKFGIFFRRLPPLAVLSRMTQMAAVVGWALLTLTIAAGAIWGAQEGKTESLRGDPMTIVVVGAWLLYSVGLSVRFLVGWRGRYTVYLSVCGFALLLISLVLVSSLHGFR